MWATGSLHSTSTCNTGSPWFWTVRMKIIFLFLHNPVGLQPPPPSSHSSPNGSVNPPFPASCVPGIGSYRFLPRSTICSHIGLSRSKRHSQGRTPMLPPPLELTGLENTWKLFAELLWKFIAVNIKYVKIQRHKRPFKPSRWKQGRRA